MTTTFLAGFFFTSFAMSDYFIMSDAFKKLFT
jgi:hypothetical protein